MPKSPARLALLVLLAGALAGCGEGAPKQAAPPPPNVTVAKPQKQQVIDYDEYVGRFVAVDMVEVRARVSQATWTRSSSRTDRSSSRAIRCS
jgi:multidrug efflux pump subunit AcrA (membrane-fusion protein)